MAQSKWIIFFGEDWGRHASTGQYLAAELAKHYRILWVNSLGLRTPSITWSDIGRIFVKCFQFMASQANLKGFAHTSPPKNIYVAYPLAIPLLQFKLVRKINQFLVRRYLKTKMKHLSIVNSIVITASVAAVDVIDTLNTSKKVYYCADEYSTMPGMNKDLIQSLEQQLISKVDLVVTTSLNLQKSKARLHNDVRYLPHGVDFDKFAGSFSNKTHMPEDLVTTNQKLIGFVGLLGEHIDFELISYVAQNIPDSTLVLIGPLEQGQEIPNQSNIVYLGPKPFSLIPNYLRHFDACIIPYVVNSPRIQYANPTKLREYLAAGCPVVSVPQPEALVLADYVEFATDKEQFVAHLKDIFKNGGKLSREELSEAMRNHTWSARATALENMIDSIC